ncbi:hypothetical protein SUGI_0084040 [Cryptomeria japonica]|nr:hypothetical protein SUGI_0084040 [Cryptomeria japonica]
MYPNCSDTVLGDLQGGAQQSMLAFKRGKFQRTSINYLLEFDDDEEDGVDGLPERTVPFFHVVQLPDGHCQ